MRAFAKFCYICYMEGFQVVIYIIIAIIFLVYKANSNNNKNKKPTAKNPPRTQQRPPALPNNAKTTSTASSDLESFLSELSKDIGGKTESKPRRFRSLEQESVNYDETGRNYDKTSINYDETAQNYDRLTPPKLRKSSAQKDDDFAKLQEEQQKHARSVSRLSEAQKKRLGHAKSVSTLSAEQKKRLEHAKPSKNKKRVITDAEDARKAFIMAEVLKRKYE